MAACSAEPADSSGPAALDLHEGISNPRGLNGCLRWPEHLRLRASNGVLVRGRCRSTNLCAYCARLAAVENSEALALDAMRHGGPAVWAVLTTRSTCRDPASFYRSREMVVRAVQRRWPAAEYAAIVEFTTGYGGRSGGLRRPHWNLLLKGVPALDLAALNEVTTSVWCAREDALPAGQYVGAIAEVGGLMKYLALHFQKESQAPPLGWRGHRLMHSRGYFGDGIKQTRLDARAQLQVRREVYKLGALLDRHEVDVDDETFEELLEQELHRRAGLTWELVAQPSSSGFAAGAERARFRSLTEARGG